MVQETLLNNRYRLIAQQGAGGMAVVYKAQDMLLGRVVAVKILRPSLTSDPAFLNRFRQEARSVANLAHPNIVTVHDVGQDRNTHYIVMEYVEGKDLKTLIRAEAPFSLDRALNLAIQICAGVGYAHRAEIVHADVKPQNVLVTDDGIVKVTDFGIARAFVVNFPGEKQAIVWGSPHYFSPEQAQGDPPTPAADVYAIGVVLFEMLTGQLPFAGKDHKELALAHIRAEVPMASDLNPAVPRKLSHIIRKVMAKEPSARYRTADQLGRILISYREQGEQTTDRQAPAAVAQTTQQRPIPPQPASAPPPAATPGASATMPAAGVPTQPAAAPAQQAAPPVVAPRPAGEATAGRYAEPLSAWPGQPARTPVDWIAVILGIAAVIAVLGLVPVWAYVYHLYAVLR